MIVLAAIFAVIITSTLAQAQTPGDPAAGSSLHEKDCVACHVRRVGGDGTGIYTRSDRRVGDLAKLRAQVAYCNSELGTAYFPDEEEHLVAWLNQRYYRFKAKE